MMKRSLANLKMCSNWLASIKLRLPDQQSRAGCQIERKHIFDGNSNSAARVSQSTAAHREYNSRGLADGAPQLAAAFAFNHHYRFIGRAGSRTRYVRLCH